MEYYGQRSATKEHLPSEKTWVLNYLRQKLASEKLLASKNSGAGQLLPCQCS